MEHQNTPQPANARACEVLSQGEWVLYPLALAAEAIERGWQVRYLVPHEEQQAAEPVAWANQNDLQNFDMKVRTNGGPLCGTGDGGGDAALARSLRRP